MNLRTEEPLAVAVVKAIQTGDVGLLQRLLGENPNLARATIGKPEIENGSSRSLLHVATDWPGHFPNGAATVATLVAAGADVNARFANPHSDETPLHWAASSNDVAVLEALLDAGADIEAPGAVIGGGTPLADAVGFAQWKAARFLIKRGARMTLAHASAMGLIDRVKDCFANETPPTQDRIHHAFWYACHGGQQRTAEYLLERGANINWLPSWEKRTPIDAAQRSNANPVIKWLRALGAKSAHELT